MGAKNGRFSEVKITPNKMNALRKIIALESKLNSIDSIIRKLNLKCLLTRF